MSILLSAAVSLLSASALAVPNASPGKDASKMTQIQASSFAKLAMKAVQKEYPNKPELVLNSEMDVRGPRALHPAFYGSFDWHSSVHGHWMLVRLLRLFPDLPERQQIRTMLEGHLTQGQAWDPLVTAMWKKYRHNLPPAVKPTVPPGRNTE